MTFWDPLKRKEKKQAKYLGWLKKLEKENRGVNVHNPLPFMPTFVELSPKICPNKDRKGIHRLRGFQTMMYNSPNTITCEKCGEDVSTRWIRINDNYIGPEIIITKDKPTKPIGKVKDLK